MAQRIKETPLRYCEACGKTLVRKRFVSGVLESLLHFCRRKYCNRQCMARAFDARQSPEIGWSTAHYHARKICPPGPCSRCGKPKARDAHHKDGNHLNNTPENLERICRTCHNQEHRQRKSCVICGKLQKGLGYCDKHYQRFKKYGDPLLVKDNQFVALRSESANNPQKGCQVATCTKSHHAKGYCSHHAQQIRRSGQIMQ